MNLFFRSKKFPDALDTRVYTTVHVVSESSIITLISHELDGDWQFMGAEPIDDYTKIAKVVGLGQIIKKDKSVLKVADLPRGYQATRINKNDAWVIAKIEYSEQEIKEMGCYVLRVENTTKIFPSHMERMYPISVPKFQKVILTRGVN